MTSNLEKARHAADDAMELFIRARSLLMNARVQRTRKLFEELTQALEEARLCAKTANEAAFDDLDPEETEDNPEVWEAHLSCTQAAEMLEGLISEGQTFLQDASPDASLAAERLAKKFLGIETLDCRHSDSLDFHDLAAWSIRSALEAAYTAGLQDGIASR